MNSYIFVLNSLLALIGYTTGGVTGRIIGGTEAPEGFAPYMVAIQNTFGEYVCGGAIIAPKWILTAGHCMDWPKKYLRIVTGTFNWTHPEAVYQLEEVQPHNLYNKPMYHNDVALIRLSTPIVYNERTQPIKIATQKELKDGDKLLFTGWGSVKVWGHPTDLVLKIELKYMEHAKCAAAVRKSSWLGDGHICTYTKPGEGTCHYDSGGPLVDQRGFLVGVLNWGEPCALGYPDVYASVVYYHEWICSTVTGSESELGDLC